MEIPSSSIALKRKGIEKKNGFWSLEHFPTCEVFIAQEHDDSPRSPKTDARFEARQPLFKTPSGVREKGIRRDDIERVREVAGYSYVRMLRLSLRLV